MTRVEKSAWDKPSLKTDTVYVEELDGDVLVRELPAEYTADISSRFEVSQVQGSKKQIAKVDTAAMERLQFAYGVIKDDGSPMFTEQEAAALAKKHGRAFKVVIDKIDEMSGIDKDAIEQAEATFPAGKESQAEGGGGGRAGD